MKQFPENETPYLSEPINWYPGHMTKARRAMEEDLKLVDMILEIRDARIPESSLNPDIGELGKNKRRIILPNKADLAEKQEELIKRAQGKDSGMWITKIGKEMELLEDEIRRFAREKKMLEYFLNDELEA